MVTTKSKQMRYDQWSLLPHDLLHKIMEKLSYSSCIYAAATCKNWNIPIPTISGSLPWMVHHNWFVVTGSNGRSQLYCKLNLYEAMNPRVFRPIFRSFYLPGETERFDIVGKVKVRDTKLGWELVVIPIIIIATRISKSLLVLYNPFVQDFRFLPALEIPRRLELATFSRPPPPPPPSSSSSSSSSSSECVVYAISRSHSFLRIHSWRWCNQMKNWEVSSSYDHYSIKRHVCPLLKFISVVAMEDGTLYCLEQYFTSLIAFKNSSNSIQAQTISFQRPVPDLVIMDPHLIEHEGELFLVYACESRGYNISNLRNRRIYMYNKSANCWSLKLDFRTPNYYYWYGNSNSAMVISRGPNSARRIWNGVYVWRIMGNEGRVVLVPLQEGEVARVPVKEMFPSYYLDGSSKVRVRLLSMGPFSCFTTKQTNSNCGLCVESMIQSG